MHRLLALLTFTGLAAAQGRDGWTVDTTLKTSSSTAAAADGDLLFATRYHRSDEAAVEVHRFDATLGRYVLEDTVRDPSWTPTHWRGFSASAEGDMCAVYSRPSFDPSGAVHVLEQVGNTWTTQSVVLPGFSAIRGGSNVAVDRRRILSSRSDVFDSLELHFIEPDASGTWGSVQALTLSLRVLYPPDNPGFLALDGDVALAASSSSLPSAHFVVCTRDPVSGLWSEEQSRPLPREDFVPSGLAVEGSWIVVGGTRPFESVAWLFERTPSGQLVRRQEISRAGAAPFGHTSVVLEGGRLLLGAGGDVHAFEPDASGTFVETARYEGLGAPVAILSGGQPGASQGTGPGRVVGRVARTARAAPYPLAPGSGGVPSFAVRQDFGVLTCYPSAPGAPELRFYSVSATNGARVTGATPGATIATFASRAAGFLPAAGGALCLERSSLFLAVLPTPASAGGETAIDLTASLLPTSLALGEGFHLQSLVLEPTGRQLTNAVHYVR